MKKIKIIFIILIISATYANLFAQIDRKLSNGFSINLVTGFPSTQYGSIKEGNLNPDMQIGTIWGLQLGNRWYISPQEKYGIGLMVNWLDITAGVATGTQNGYDFGRAVANVSFFEIGPIATYALTSTIALDAYYNLRPTGFSKVVMYVDPYGSNDDETYNYAGFGLTHALGTAFRYKALNIGLEYVTGAIESEGTYTGPRDNVTLKPQENLANNFRIMIGAKF